MISNKSITINNHYNVFLIGFFFRVIIFTMLVIYPFEHNLFGSISPLSYQDFADLGFSINFGQKEFFLNDFINIYLNIITLNFDIIDNRYPGPVFPLLIYITNYSKDFTYLFSIVIFSIELIAFYFWSKYFFEKIDKICSILFCFLPIPLYFGFFHSTDIVFYFLSTFIYLILIKYIKTNNDRSLILLLILITLVRPACLSILSVVMVFSFFNKTSLLLKISNILLIFFAIIYYAPYFILERNIVDNYKYFSYDVFLPIKYLITYIIKLFYLLGFIKSDSGNLYFYLMRCVCGVIFAIGYIYSFYKRKFIDLIYINLTILPVVFLFFPAYRYSLAIIPLLFMYFYIFLNNTLRNRLGIFLK